VVGHGDDPVTIGLADDVLARALRAGASEAEVLVMTDDSQLTRFANSEIHQNVAESNVAVNLRFVHGRRMATASTGRKIFATSGTAAMVRSMGIPVTEVEKRLAGARGKTVVDVIEDGTVQAVVNTVTGDRRALQDGFHIRRAAVERRIPCFTSIDTARAAVESLEAGDSAYNVMTMKEYLEG